MKIRLLILFFFSITSISAQQTSFGFGMHVDRLAKINLSQLDNAKLMDDELAARKPGRAEHFAVNRQVSVTPGEDGTWEELSPGKWIWRIRISSPEAYSLNLGFTKYVMPPSGKLYIYSADQRLRQGPFSIADNAQHDELWTPIIESDDIVIEVQINQKDKSSLALELTYVNHAFDDLSSSRFSGSCNLDVVCGTIDGYDRVEDHRDIIRSVAAYHRNGTSICTGFLVNNGANNCAPYFMTAAHCGNNAGNASSVVAYWLYENSYCRPPFSSDSGQNGDGGFGIFNSGAFLRANFATSDFSLLEFDSPINDDADPYFAGWSNENVAPQTAIAIHHPGVQEKRISFEDDNCTITNYFSDNNNSSATHIRVEDWDVGTTEGGSSGSPLFDQDEYVVGQLHGGTAACGNNEPDWYGKFALSWTGGGTNATRLRNWLDPNNQGLTRLEGRDGRNCNVSVDVSPFNNTICAGEDAVYTIEVSMGFTDDVDLTLLGLPSGVNFSFSNNPVVPGGITTLTLTNTSVLLTGPYPFNIVGSDTNGGQDEFLANLTVVDAAPQMAQLEMPLNNETNVSSVPEFVWSDISTANSYKLQVASDMAFNTILFEESNLTASSYGGFSLAPLSTYYWRVIGSNPCGDGPDSEVYSFSTGNCFVVSNNNPLSISSGAPSTVTSTISFANPAVISDVNVSALKGDHTYIGDLTISLRGPTNQEVVLFENLCGDLANFDIAFDDAANGTIPCPMTDGEVYPPQQMLSVFNNTDAQGDWDLIISDGAFQDGGLLEEWSLQICAEVTGSLLDFSTLEITTCSDEIATLEIEAGQGFGTSGAAMTVAGAPMDAVVDFSSNPILPGTTSTVSFSNFDPGTYNLTFTGVSPANTDIKQVELTVLPAAIAPMLMSPMNLGMVSNSMVTFDWDIVTGADEYEIEVAEDDQFLTIAYSETVTTNQAMATLTTNRTYYWRVSTINSCGEEASPTYEFMIEADLTGILQPAALSVCQADEAVFNLQIGTDFDPAGVTLSALPFGNASFNFSMNPAMPGSSVDIFISNLMNEPVGSHNLTINLDDALGNHIEVQPMLSIEALADAPSLMTPTNLEVDVPIMPTLTWQDLGGVGNFLIEVSLQSDFATTLISETIATNSYDISILLDPTTTYYWRVKNIGGCDASSDIFEFTTEQGDNVLDPNGFKLELYPNPSNGLITVQSSATANGTLYYNVYSNLGQLILKSQFNANTPQNIIDLQDISSGIYLIQFIQNNKTRTHKVIIE